MIGGKMPHCIFYGVFKQSKIVNNYKINGIRMAPPITDAPARYFVQIVLGTTRNAESVTARK